MGRVKTCCVVAFWTWAVLGLAAAIGVYWFKGQHELRRQQFAGLCSHMTAHGGEGFRELRCGSVARNATGVVVEIGPGAGANFECWNGTTAAESGITNYTGIEPNAHFRPILEQKAASMRLPFPVRILTAGAETPLIADGSVDTVVLTHVLCSVGGVALSPEAHEEHEKHAAAAAVASLNDDPLAAAPHDHPTGTEGGAGGGGGSSGRNNAVALQILRNVARMLKPGGRFLFLEHVAARDPESWTASIQRTVAPVWDIFGGGCGFEPTWTTIEQVRPLFASLEYEHFSAECIPLPFIQPHIRGVAIK